MMRFPCAAAKTGKTTGHGQSITKPSTEFIDRCQECDGTYPARKITLENGMKKGKKTPKPKRIDGRRHCHICKRRPKIFFRSLQALSLQWNASKRKMKRWWKLSGTILCSSPKTCCRWECGAWYKWEVFDDEYGELSCWHIAHRDLWKKHLRRRLRLIWCLLIEKRSAEYR